jgi:hypothetical protein
MVTVEIKIEDKLFKTIIEIAKKENKVEPKVLENILEKGIKNIKNNQLMTKGNKLYV